MISGLIKAVREAFPAPGRVMVSACTIGLHVECAAVVLKNTLTDSVCTGADPAKRWRLLVQRGRAVSSLCSLQRVRTRHNPYSSQRPQRHACSPQESDV
jgi:hypothetical protein